VSDEPESLVILQRPAEGIALVTLDRPDRRNALSVALRDQLADDLDELAADESVRVLVIAGAGPVFSAGFDLREFERAMEDPQFGEELWASSDRYHRRVLTFPLPSIAAVGGPAVAGGMDLAVMCDLRVVSTTATFSHPEYTFGDVVYGPLRDLVGGAMARELCMTGRVLDADEALAIGLPNAVVEPDRVIDRALEMAGAVAAAPRAMLMRTKEKVLRQSGVVAGATLDL
jgi:enoyl-CoA hydratase